MIEIFIEIRVFFFSNVPETCCRSFGTGADCADWLGALMVAMKAWKLKKIDALYNGFKGISMIFFMEFIGRFIPFNRI